MKIMICQIQFLSLQSKCEIDMPMRLPEPFVENIRALLGEEESLRLCETLTQTAPPVSVRLNPWKRTADSSLSILPASPEKISWATDAFYLDERPAFTFDPLLHAGCYYVQEASSMFVEQALRQCLLGDKPVAALDLCAAPGGKSTLLRSLLPAGSLLVANEVVRSRAQVLAENLTKWGHPDVVVTNSDPADFTPLADSFDLLLTDVPCSGEGMFRKDEGAVSEWSMENVENCWKRQRRILSDIWPCLKPGGLFIYSTCTYNIKEDEENVRWIRDELGAEILPLDVPEEWGVTGNLLAGEDFPVYRFLPHRTRGEGFFLAVLRKEGEDEPPSYLSSAKAKDRRGKGKDKTRPLFGKAQLAEIGDWLKGADGYTLLPEENTVSAFPAAWLPLLDGLKRQVRVMQAGVALAEQKGKDCLPLHALAMSVLLRPDAFPRQEVDYPQAIAYLRKEAVTLPDAAPRGMVLLTYRDVPLGFVKNIGNRANNLYPQEWRIRKSL